MRIKKAQIGKHLTHHVIKGPKKYSFQTKRIAASVGQLYPHFKVNFESAYSEAVVKTFVEDLLETLEHKFRQVDQKKFFNSIIQNLQELEQQVACMLDPMVQVNKMKIQTPYLGKEPQTAAVQAHCGGKTAVLDRRKTPAIRSSITFQASKDVEKSHNISNSEIKSALSSKDFIKLSNQPNIQEKRSMEALKLQSKQLNDKHDELIKQKMFKQNVLNLPTNLFRPKVQFFDKTNSKFNNNLTTIDQYNYDYDGSALPLKKFGRPCPEKIKILNPSYKVIQKDLVQLRKVKASKYNFSSAFKTEGQQGNKINTQTGVVQQLNLARKSVKRVSVNDLGQNQKQQEQDYEWKNKLENSIKSKSIRIRQLKQI